MAFGWKPYVPVAKRRAKAARKMKQLEKKGLKIEPVEVQGRKIARTFWGEAWCNHMEQLSDFANRLPRGRTYVRNGSVCHLSIQPGQVDAIVSGSELYQVSIQIKPLAKGRWKGLRDQCAGQIGSMLELLQGQFSNQVMAIVTHPETGLFPKPSEITTHCDCPDWADLCKHLAAVLYGIGARLDEQPELLFKLRGVDHEELIDSNLDLTQTGQGKRRRIEDDDLSALFGVDLDQDEPAQPKRPAARKKRVAKAPVGAASAKTSTAEFIPSAESIAALRKRLGMNRTEFAVLAGVSSSTVANWERKQGPLKLQRIPHHALMTATALTPEEARTRMAEAQHRRRAAKRRAARR